MARYLCRVHPLTNKRALIKTIRLRGRYLKLLSMYDLCSYAANLFTRE